MGNNTNVRGKINHLKLLRGYSAYEIALFMGFVGTEEEWLASIQGKSAYQYAVEGGFTGTEEEFAAKLAAL